MFSITFGAELGDISGVEDSKEDDFKDLIKVTETNRRIVDENLPNGFLFRAFTVVLVINNEEYTLTRDWAEEYEINKKNNFKSDNWFYERLYNCKKNET